MLCTYDVTHLECFIQRDGLLVYLLIFAEPRTVETDPFHSNALSALNPALYGIMHGGGLFYSLC